MKIEKWAISVGICLLISLVACSWESPVERATRELLEMEEGYCSGDPGIAEKALLTDLEMLESQMEAGLPGRDYAFSIAVDHARLYGVYDHCGETRRAEIHFSLCASNLWQWRATNGSPQVEITTEHIRQLLSDFDKGLEVGWKGN